MHWSRMFIPTLRESPAKEMSRALALMVRAGYAHVEAGRACAYLPLGTRCVRRIRELVRKGLAEKGGQEFCLAGTTTEDAEELDRSTGFTGCAGSESPVHPVIVSKRVGLAPRMRNERHMLVQIASGHLQSYRELPQMWFCFATDPSDREGQCVTYYLVLRDGEAAGKASHDPAGQALSAVIEKCGLNILTAQSLPDPGREDTAEETLCLSPDGRVEVAFCRCGYGANVDCAVSRVEEDPHGEPPPGQPQLVETPGKKTIADVCEFLDVPPTSLIKSLLYMVAGQPVLALVRGDDQLNERLLCQALGSGDLRPANAEEVEALFGAEPGSIGPVGKRGVRILADHALRSCGNMVCGANQDDYHLTGVEPERDFRAGYVHLRQVCAGDPCPECGKSLAVERAYRFMRSATLLPPSGEPGPLRVLGPDNKPQRVSVISHRVYLDTLFVLLIEQFSDDDGIVLPPGVAPFDVVITPIKYGDEAQKEVCDQIYQALAEEGVEVLLDDRDASPGVKFKDADLIGVPLRITIGPKKLKEGSVELRSRATGESVDCPLEDVVEHVTEVLRSTESTG